MAAMSRASVFVHASRYETFGVVAAEALAAGMPIVATASGGVSEILGDDPSSLGAVVPVDDAQAFAAAVLEVLERRPSFDPARLHAAAERFGPAIVGGRLADLYDDVIAESGPLARSPLSRVTTIEPDRAREPAGVESERSTVVLALDRRAAATLLAKLPERFRRTIALVTSDRPQDIALPETGRLLEVAVPPLPAPPSSPPRAEPAGLILKSWNRFSECSLTRWRRCGLAGTRTRSWRSA